MNDPMRNSSGAAPKPSVGAFLTQSIRYRAPLRAMAHRRAPWRAAKVSGTIKPMKSFHAGISAQYRKSPNEPNFRRISWLGDRLRTNESQCSDWMNR